MHFNYVTGSEPCNRVLAAFGNREIAVPLVIRTVHPDGRVCVTDTQGRSVPSLLPKHEHQHQYKQEVSGG